MQVLGETSTQTVHLMNQLFYSLTGHIWMSVRVMTMSNSIYAGLALLGAGRLDALASTRKAVEKEKETD